MANKRDVMATATDRETLQAKVSALADLRRIVDTVVHYVDRCKMMGVAAPMTPYVS